MTKRDVLIVYILLYYALIPEDEQQELSAITDGLYNEFDKTSESTSSFALRTVLESMINQAAEIIIDSELCTFVNQIFGNDTDD